MTSESHGTHDMNIETSAEQVSEERNAIEEAIYALQCSRVWIMVAIEGPVDSNSEAVARTDLERANDAIRSLRELLSARTVGEPFAWYCAFPRHGHLTMRQDEAEAATADGATVTKLYASPPPPQPGVRVTEEMLEARDEVEDITARAEAMGLGMAKYFVPNVRLLLAALTASIPDSGEPG